MRVQQISAGVQGRGGRLKPAGVRVSRARAAKSAGGRRDRLEERSRVLNGLARLDAGVRPGAGQACFGADRIREHQRDVRRVPGHDGQDVGHAAREV